MIICERITLHIDVNKKFLEHINELFDSNDLFGNAEKNIYILLKNKFPDISEEDIAEFRSYLHGFYEYCVKYGDILADKYKTPFLPKDDEVEKEIAEYVSECQKQYPDIDSKHIISIFGTVCWLANR